MTTSSLTDQLVEAGLVTGRQIEAAWQARERGGGLLALHLVLLGSIDGEALARFAADELALPRATDDELLRATRSDLDLLPADVAYEHGLISLGFTDASRLLVCAFDPSERAALEEAQYFAGVELELRVASAQQIAGTFERVMGRPWRVSTEELSALGRGLGEGRDRLDAELRSLFSRPSETAGREVAETPARGLRVEPAVIAAEPVVELTSVRLEPAADSDDVDIVELVPSQRVVRTPAIGGELRQRAVAIRVEALEVADGPVVELRPASGATAPTRVELPARGSSPALARPAAALANPLPPPVASARSEVVDRETIKEMFEPQDSDAALLDPDSISQVGFPAAVTGSSSTVGDGVPAQRSFRLASVSGALESIGARRTTSGGRLPTVGELLTEPGDGVFRTIDAVAEVAAAPATDAAFELAAAAVLSAPDRDAIARQICESLSLVYPNVLLLAPRGGRIVPWDSALTGGDGSSTLVSFELGDGDIWGRVADSQQVFDGTLPIDDPLRRALPRSFGRGCLVAPMTLSGRVIAILVLGAGGASPPPPPGRGLRSLQGAVERALRELITRRKQARGPV